MGLVAVVLLGYAGYTLLGNLGSSDSSDVANTRTLMDSETGELFKVELTENFGAFPHKNPKTGTDTLYPIEICYARECANKPDGTPVILNAYLGKKEPTFCPNCGALVRVFNPGRRRDTSDDPMPPGP
jgi:hypothetical protein